MKRYMTFGVLFFVLTIAGGTPSLAEEPLEDWSFDGFLYEDTDGQVWAGCILVHLGMVGVMAGPPVYKLSPELQAQFAPLINHVQLEPLGDEPRDYFWFELPKPEDAGHPLILVNFRAKVRTIEKVPRAKPDDFMSREVYEIVSLNLLHAEFVSSEWREAWNILEYNLGHFIAATLVEPGPEKNKQLKTLAESGAESLRNMLKSMNTFFWKERVIKLAPDAHVTNLFQRHKTREWGDVLKQCVDRLGLHLDPPFPDLPQDCDLISLLAGAASPEAFNAAARTTCDEEQLCQNLFPIHTSREESGGGKSTWLSGYLYGWDILNVSAERFNELREEARKRIDEREKPQPMEKFPASATASLDDLGVIVEPLKRDEQVQYGILAGAKVIEVLSKGKEIGLQAGDILPTSTSTYQVAMGTESFRPHRNREKGLCIIRGARMIYIPLKP